MKIYDIDNVDIDKLDIKYYFYKYTMEVDMNIINTLISILFKQYDMISAYIHRDCVEIKVKTHTSSWLLDFRYYYKNIVIVNNKLYLSEYNKDELILKRLKKISKFYEKY